MLNPGDNRNLGCFVREARIDNDFKLALYPRWLDASSVLGNLFCKTKEYYYKMVTDPQVERRIKGKPLELAKLHHDWAELTDQYTSEMDRISRDYSAKLLQKLNEFANRLDPNKRIANKIERCFKPYVEEAEKKRKSIFEDFQKNLIDGLLWEHTTRDNRRVEEGQPSVGNNQNAEPEHQASVTALNWDDYIGTKFASSKSAIDNLRADNAPTGNGEEDDQVRSVN